MRHLHLVQSGDTEEWTDPGDTVVTLPYAQVVMWMDHRRATLIGFSWESAALLELHGDGVPGRLHTKSGTRGSGHVADDHALFDALVAALADSRRVLITGPGTAKIAFERYVRDRHADFAAKIVGIETLDHPGDGTLLGYGRRYFKRLDQLGAV